MTTYPKLSYTIVPYHLALGVAMALQPLRASDHLYEASTSRYEDDKAVQSTNNDVQPNQDKPTHGMDTTRPKTSSRAKEKQDVESEQTNRNPILIAVGSAALVLGTAYRSWGGLYLTNTPNTLNTSNTFQPNEKPTPIVVYNVMTKNNTPQPRTKSKHDLTTNLPAESDIPNKKSPKEAQKHKKDFLTLQSLQSNTNQRPTSPKYENSSNNTKTDLRTKTFVGKTKQGLSKTHLLNNADSTDNGRKASVATSLSHRTWPPLSEVEGTGGTFDENMNSNTNSKPVAPPAFNPSMGHASAPTAYTNRTQNDNQPSFGYPILLPEKTSHDTLNISPISPQQPFQMPFNNQGSPTMQNVMTQDNNDAPNKGNTLNANHNAFGSNVNSSVPNNISENESNTEPEKSDKDTSNDDTNGDNTTENEPNTDDENNTEVNTQEALNNKPEKDNKSTSKKNDNKRSIKNGFKNIFKKNKNKAKKNVNANDLSNDNQNADTTSDSRSSNSSENENKKKSWFKNPFKNKGNKNKDQKNVTEPTDNTNTQEVSNNTPENEHENSTSIDTQTMSDSHSKNDTKDKLELKSKKEKKKLEKERKKKEKKLLKEQEKQKKKNNVGFIEKMKIKFSKRELPPHTKPV